MNPIVKTLLFFLCSIAFLTSFVHAEDKKKTDTWKEATITTAIALNPNLNPFEIEVYVVNGVARLTGEVDETTDKDLAEHLALTTDGVSGVKNEILVADRHTTAKRAGEERRSFARAVSDATTTAKVKSRLLWNRNTSGLAIEVSTDDNVVTLEGEVEDPTERDLALQIAKNTTPVESVNDQLRVKNAGKIGTVDLDKVADNAKSAIADIDKDISDSWITTKVTSMLVFSRNVSSGKIDVSTENGVVTLTGLAETSAEKDLAEEITKDVVGVRSVQNRLQTQG